MDQSQLIAVMKFQLENFKSVDVPITDSTIHGDVLSDEGVGAATGKRLYKGAIRWTLHNAGHEDHGWPDNWLDLSVKELAGKLIE